MKTILPILGIALLLTGCVSSFENHTAEFSTSEIQLSQELRELTIKESPQGICTIHIGALLQKYFTGDPSAPGKLDLIDCEIHTHTPILGQAINSLHLTTRLTINEEEYFISVIGDKSPSTSPGFTGAYEADAIDAARKTYFRTINHTRNKK